LLFSRDHARNRARKAKGAVGRRRHRGRRNASKKREWKRPLTVGRCCNRFFHFLWNLTAEETFRQFHVQQMSKCSLIALRNLSLSPVFLIDWKKTCPIIDASLTIRCQAPKPQSDHLVLEGGEGI
jgi:hypothetical protein